jgi:hypothetical protein
MLRRKQKDKWLYIGTGCSQMIIFVSNSNVLPFNMSILWLNIFELQGWLPGLKGEGDTEQLPTIAIVANYDTFDAAPVRSFKNFLP